jgi:chaperone modulatory protein CbpM
MSTDSTPMTAQVVEEEIHLTLIELCRATGTREEQVVEWVGEGVVEPLAPAAQPSHDWRFAGPALRRARLAARLARDLEVNVAGIALALDLMDEIAALKTELQRLGLHR